jgi:hypothetical protein
LSGELAYRYGDERLIAANGVAVHPLTRGGGSAIQHPELLAVAKPKLHANNADDSAPASITVACLTLGPLTASGMSGRLHIPR